MTFPVPRRSLPDPVMTAEDCNRFLEEAFPQFERSYEVTEVTDDGVVVRIPIGAEHERPGGTVSGPVMMTAADSAAWLATLSRIGPVALAVTSSLTIDFLRKPSLDADLWARAGLLKLGRRLSVSEVALVSGPEDGAGELVAHATVTYAIPS